jgi:uncharacterized membrane protein (DUF373 family)
MSVGDIQSDSPRSLLPPVDSAIARAVKSAIIAIENAIVFSLLLVAAIVLVRTLVAFFQTWGAFPQSIVPAVDGILVVVILLDVAHTVFGHMRSSVFPVRPFIVIGVLAGVRDILSASAHLTLANLTGRQLNDTLMSLGVGVGVVVALLLGLAILRYSGHEDDEPSRCSSTVPTAARSERTE